MSTFKNVSGVDLEVQVDGRRIAVASEDSFKVADEFDYTLESQPSFELVKSKSAVAESTPESVSVTEEKK